jgi:hypothetical protein
LPIDTFREDLRRLVRTVVHHGTTLEELRAFLIARAHDGTWAYATLADARAWTLLSGADAIHELAEVQRDLAWRYGRRGPVALVVQAPDDFAMARAYTALAEPAQSEARVFFDMRIADEWLREQGF